VLNFSPEKLFLVGVIALFVLGPNRLPQAARSLGRMMATLRRMSSGFQEEVRSALSEQTDGVSSAVAEFRPANVRRTIRDGVTSVLGPAQPNGDQPATNLSTGARPTGNQAIDNQPTGTPDDPTLN
jgi:sec-independent protein translocase protein TatB